MEFLVFQGTDYALELRLPYEIGSEDPAVCTLVQGQQTVLEYRRNADPAPETITPTGQLLLDAEDPALLKLCMTQADTLRLAPGLLRVQLRVATSEGAETFRPILGTVGSSANTEEL